MPGQVVELLTADQAGAPMRSRREVDVESSVGIVGDRYQTGRGHWSDPRWPDQELTFVMAEVADRLGLPASALRRNVVTRGIDLDDLIGVTFRVGASVLHGVRRCDPCVYLEQFTRVGIPRLLGNDGGLRVHVVVGGRIRVGDAITIDASTGASAGSAAAERGYD